MTFRLKPNFFVKYKFFALLTFLISTQMKGVLVWKHSVMRILHFNWNWVAITTDTLSSVALQKVSQNHHPKPQAFHPLSSSVLKRKQHKTLHERPYSGRPPEHLTKIMITITYHVINNYHSTVAGLWCPWDAAGPARCPVFRARSRDLPCLIGRLIIQTLDLSRS